MDVPTLLAMPAVWSNLLALPGRALILAIRAYQWTLSPILGRQCRFEPTCSEYMIGSVRKYGCLVGSWRGIRRILRCHPFYRGSAYDPP